ncbi:hypothetical protein JYT90_01105, partial [bacterium AH-315-P07]|nr:hypothetical protein [bacterium AH-315-P07]
KIAAPKFNNKGWSIGEPDLVVKMDKPFTIPDHEDDSQPTIQIKGTVNQDRWIKAIEVKPGNYELVHHTLVYLINADGARSNHPFGGGELVGLYGPGFPPVSFPAEHGKLFKKNSNIVLSMHYHKDIGPGTAASDQTSVGMIFADGPVKNPVTTAWVGSQELNIPPFADNVESRAAFTFKDDGHILSLMPHLHYRGKDFSYTAEYPDGTVQTLLDVPEFDFNWQIGYVMKEPMPMPRGTVIRVVAHHDNSIGNPYNPDPTQFVTWGSSTDDEMMIGFMDYTYASLKSQQTEFPDSPQAASSQRARKDASTGNATSRTLNKNVGAGRILRGFDKNRDGKIEKSEVPEGFYGFFEDFDRNKDGYLTRDEL